MSDIFFQIFPIENFIDLSMAQYGCEQCEPGHSFGPVSRNHYLFHYILSGCGTLCADNAKGVTQTFSIHSGEGFLIFPGQITNYYADCLSPWKYIWIEFDGLRVKEALSMTTLTVDTPVYRSAQRELREQMVNEMLYLVNHPKESPFHLIGHLYLFLDYLTRSFKSNHLSQSSKLSDYYVSEAIHFMEQNYQKHITMEDLALFCGINRSYLGKIFHNAIGRSPQEFLIHYRMAKATELLKLTSSSIAEIGICVGYENQLHFSRAFKNVYGISPKEWRRQNK